MQSMTMRTFNGHGTQREPLGGVMIWTTCFRNGGQSLIVVDGHLNALHFCLLIHLLLLSGIVLLFQGFHLPFTLLLLLQFILLSLVLQSFHLPLMLLLLLQFLLVSLVLHGFHLPLMLLLLL